MIGRRYSRLEGALAAALVSVTALPAGADGGLALDRFDPAPAGDRMFGVESPFVNGQLTPHASLLADYAHNPVVLRSTTSGESAGAVVSSQLIFHLDASLALFDRLNVNLDLPVALFQAGNDPTGGDLRLSSPSGVQLGDLRAGLRVRIVGDYDDAFQLAIGGYLWFPSGASGAFMSDGAVRGRPELILGGRSDRVVWSTAAGPELRPSQTYGSVTQGTMLRWGGGLGVLLGERRRFQLGPEATFAVVLSDPGRRTINAEALVGARLRVLDDIEVGLGAGTGFSSGIGTPDFRGVLMVAYTKEHKKPRPDRDKDGVPDSEDVCPDTPGLRNANLKRNGCPLPQDRDKDGIFDEDDACPDASGVMNDDPRKNGCPTPKDRDRDGIADDEDACPGVPGILSDDPQKNGCPIVTLLRDSDGDGIADHRDACPNERGLPDKEPENNGCPVDVRVTDVQIVIKQQVQFDTGKATIKKASDSLLDEVASVLKQHPEITRLEVQGHTDDRGFAKDNQVLSQDRAGSVQAALIKRGIDAGRLVARGYGQDQPIDDNKTAAGQQVNRRVEFKILEKAAKPPKH